MIDTDRFCARLIARGFTSATGVPCSYFTGPIERLSRDNRYVPAANEGAALAIAAGAALGGSRVAVFAQNSGLGNLINPLTSLLMTYDIPVLAFVSLRGWPDPSQDEPQHAVMGRATSRMLDALGVAWWLLTATTTDLDRVLDEAERELARGRPAFVLVEKGAITGIGTGGAGSEAAPGGPGAGEVDDGRAACTRAEVLRAIRPELRDLPIISTTGYTSRELFALGDADTHFYMQGSMGHATALGLGLARTGPATRPVIVLDGDGAALMHLGTMSTVGFSAPANLVHVLFDNGAYESTGAQATTSAATDFVGIGLACGYRSALACARPEDARSALRVMLSTPGPHLLVVRVAPAGAGATAPARATSAVSAPRIYRRLRARLATDGPDDGETPCARPS
ncbi:phosphonopyruvate decarboxylase [Frankia sp. AgB32]|uniref:phosphonopyruvate decarboxylase n=1 Tax=Frankia sp. AgB32 TaxID=631119 RepID=UPI00200E6256|nr:phosphonopyruvate decarboxylase [Frankia sp. AgB32]MCK9896090.1 phosphonopyruvate decarboxylase [Frankia sp. AgB32]